MRHESDSYSKAPFDSRQLRAFLILAKTGSFTIAGKKLFLTQSAVSHAMKALERDAGCRLFDKVGKTVVLTQAGEHLYHHAQKILNQMDQARETLEHLGKWGQGRLRLGVTSTAAQYILPPVLRQFRTNYPQSTITIEPGDTFHALKLFEQNRIDLAICLEPPNSPEITFLPLFTDELVFLVGEGHAWALEGKPAREQIPKQNYILYNKRSLTFKFVEEYFREEEMVLNSFIEIDNIEAMKELVKLNMGVSILAPWIARKELTEGSLVAFPLGKRKLKRNWGILHHKNRRLSLAEETFVKLCRNSTEALSGNEPAK
ncbi:MAG: LysR family transcriptional regulator [Verrucomicrobiota bacterium]|nr:LysR family transcriptional regulator [Verrucomicrobiota bacterium]